MAFVILGFEKEIIDEIYFTLSGILLLGNLEFDSTVDEESGLDVTTIKRTETNDGFFLKFFFFYFSI